MSNLTGKELVEQGIVTKPGEDCIQQHGVDLELISVEQLFGIGRIPKKGKTRLVEYKEVEQSLMVIEVDSDNIPIDSSGWQLVPGVYNVVFKQGCNIPKDKMALIRQRSSLMRNGTNLHSSIFDAGFSTDHVRAVIVVSTPIEIEYEARIAQMYAHNSNPVEELYSGQFLEKK